MLVNEHDKRLIKLMTYLYNNNNKWLNINELMLHLNVSRKTIYTYVHRLEYIFSGLVKFNFSGSMIKISVDSRFGILTMQRTFLNESLIIKILKLTFFRTDIDKLEISINLDVSETSIYRSIRFLNDSLDGVYKLNYSYSDLCFIGSEEEIRKFYINLFIETNPNPSDWVFDELLDQDSINVLVRSLKPYIHDQIFYDQFQYLKIGIAISIIRFKQGYRMYSKENNKELLNIVQDLSKNQEIVNFIKKEFPLSKYSLKDILYQILVYFSSDNFLSFVEKTNNFMGDDFDYKKHYAYYDEKISQLIKKHNISLKNKEELYNLIFTHFKFKLSNIDGVDFFVDHSKYFINYVKFLNPDFHNDLSQILKDYLDIFNPKSKYKLNDLIYTVYTLWTDLIPQLIKLLSKTKVLIISHYDYYYAKSLENILKLWFENLMDVETFDGYEIDFEKIKESDFDIIISDFVIRHDLGDKLIFTYEQFPLINEISDLGLEISQKYLENNLKNYSQDFESLKKL